MVQKHRAFQAHFSGNLGRTQTSWAAHPTKKPCLFFPPFVDLLALPPGSPIGISLCFAFSSRCASAAMAAASWRCTAACGGWAASDCDASAVYPRHENCGLFVDAPQYCVKLDGSIQLQKLWAAVGLSRVEYLSFL